MTVQRATIEHHLAEPGIVVDRGHEPAAPRFEGDGGLPELNSLGVEWLEPIPLGGIIHDVG